MSSRSGAATGPERSLSRSLILSELSGWPLADDVDQRSEATHGLDALAGCVSSRCEGLQG